MRRLIRLSMTAAAAGLASIVVAAPASAAPATPGHLHATGRYSGHPAQPQKGGARTRNMTYHGGPVEQVPAVYISWWGPEWSAGFSTGGYTSAQLQTYMTGFFSNVGGSGWANIDTQYCQGVAKGTVNCGSAGTHVTNPKGQLKGTWNDTTAVPSSPSQTDINNAAIRLEQHFGYSANATYFVFTPTGKSQSGFAGVGGNWCAYHSEVNSGGKPVFFAYMPYQTDAGQSCGENFINAKNDSYGNGYFDGFSVVGGHEYAEAVTDPYTASGNYAWYDSSGNEIGDKCAWAATSTDITLGSHYYAVQPLWSNVNSGCVTSH
jgi:hypothetical protein